MIVIEAISREFRIALPWQLLYADDLVVIAETEELVIKRLNEWKNNVQNRGMRVNINKSSAATEMGDCGHNRHGPKRGAAVPPSRGRVKLGSRLTQCGLG